MNTIKQIRLDGSISIAKVIKVEYIKSEFPLGTQNGLNYHVFPSEER